MSSGIRAITAAAAIDHELVIARGITLAAWLDANAVSRVMLEAALAGSDPFGVLDMLASTLGVLRESLPRAA